jgi:hypothetical protein
VKEVEGEGEISVAAAEAAEELERLYEELADMEIETEDLKEQGRAR